MTDLKLRKCKECGKMFKPSSARQFYCKDIHYRPCPVCGKLVEVKRGTFNDPPRCCSKACAVKLRQSTCLNLYGTVDPGNSDIGKEKRKQTCLKKYGVENPAVLESSVVKAKQTCLNRYGVDSYSKTSEQRDRIKKLWSEKSESEISEISDKRRKTCLEKYGVENPRQCPEIQDKMKHNLFEQYGVTCSFWKPDIRERTLANHKKSVRDPELQARITKTMIDRYGGRGFGTDYMSQAMIRKYGKAYAAQVPEFVEKQKQTCYERYGQLPILSDEAWQHNRDARLKNNGFSRISKVNRDIAKRLNDLGIDTEFEKIIESRWFDICLPNSNIVIEVDPTFTHASQENEAFHTKVDKYYHRDKSKLAEKHGYRCIHIFDWDYIDIILNSLIENKQIIYGRNTDIHVVSNEIAAEFLNTYHYQKSVSGIEIAVGLFYEDELMSLMTFGSPRYNSNYEWELLRYVTHPKYSVVGGSQKLFKAFVENADPQNIISYCDRAKFTGDVYSKLGFQLVRTNSPGKIWSKGKQHVNNSLLMSLGYDKLFKTDYGKGTNNEQLMIDNGWKSVYDCGQAVYEWVR